MAQNTGTRIKPATSGGGGTADAVWDETAASHVAAGSFGKSIADTLVDTGTTLPAEHTAITSNVNSKHVATDALITTVDGVVDGIQVDLNAVRIRKPQPSAISARIASLALSNVAGDKDFANVVFPANFIPATATVIGAYLMLMFGDRKNTSVAENKINAAAKTVRIKLSGGVWGTDDIVAMTLPINGWSTDASSRGSGGLLVGSVNLNSVLANPGAINGATVNVRSEETNASEGITVTAASLTLYDIDSFIIVEYSL